MGSITIADLIQGYNAYDFGARGDGNGDQGPAINRAMEHASLQTRANGLVVIPPGDYRIATSITPLSNITLMGFGRATRLFLGNDANVDVVRCESIDSFRMMDLRIDGNRANNSSGNGNGIYMSGVSDSFVSRVQVESCRADGVFMANPIRVELTNCRGSDNGRHGFSLNTAEFCLLTSIQGMNNCQVETAGVGDGLNLDVLSHDNVVINAACYESSLAGVLQGYGIREQAAGGCYRNLFIGGSFQGNLNGQVLTEPDSLWIAYNSISSGGLGLGTTSPNASALFDLTSSRLGFLPPRVTTIQRDAISSPASGLVVYNTTSGKLNVYTGAAWEAVTSA